MINSLNRWQRIGVILTAVYIIIVTLFLINDFTGQKQRVTYEYSPPKGEFAYHYTPSDQFKVTKGKRIEGCLKWSIFSNSIGNKISFDKTTETRLYELYKLTFEERLKISEFLINRKVSAPIDFMSWAIVKANCDSLPAVQYADKQFNFVGFLAWLTLPPIFVWFILKSLTHLFVWIKEDSNSNAVRR